MSEENKTIEIKDENTEKAVGGIHNYKESAGYKFRFNGNDYDVVDWDWACPCRRYGHYPIQRSDLPAGYRVDCCEECRDFCRLYDAGAKDINGWQGFCLWR